MACSAPTDPSVPAPALVCHDLGKDFRAGFLLRRHAVLNGIELRLAQGESLALVGPNGAGKTTLLRLAAGIEAPTRGRVELFGQSPEHPRARGRVGFCAEHTPFPDAFTPLRALLLVGAIHGLGRGEARERAQYMLQRVGLRGLAGRRLGRLSRGMRKRFNLAQAFLHGPDLVLLDEPTAGLDAPGFGVLEDLLDEARARGASIALCSHSLADVVRHAEQVCVLVDGRICARGSLANVISDPRRIELGIEALGEDALGALDDALASAGARIVSRRPANRTLIELYRRSASTADVSKPG